MKQTTEPPVNRMYKSRIFAMLYQEKKELLDLYNAISGKHYEDPELLEINTLENAIYMTMKNDLSFLIDFRLSLYEHQSTYSARVREYANIMPISEAVEQAICECIQEGILAEFLTQNRAEAKQVSIYEYDEEKHMRQEREASWEEGWTTGRMELLKELIQKKLSKGMSVSEIAIELEEEEALISELIQELEK